MRCSAITPIFLIPQISARDFKKVKKKASHWSRHDSYRPNMKHLRVYCTTHIYLRVLLITVLLWRKNNKVLILFYSPPKLFNNNLRLLLYQGTLQGTRNTSNALSGRTQTSPCIYLYYCEDIKTMCYAYISPYITVLLWRKKKIKVLILSVFLVVLLLKKGLFYFVFFTVCIFT